MVGLCIRKIKSSEIPVLSNFLYEAIFIPDGVEPPPREIINQPELQIYISNFGEFDNDICFVAEADDRIVGACWVRIMNDYGHINDETPSFAIALYKEYRNQGIGTALMETMLRELRERDYKQVSLSVQKANYAVKMYENVGFQIIDENEEEYIMSCDL
ncbi:GNAT family N-acetyltransferase [Bifidobacterium gallicum]|nr:GNAT family N-acetyltransferase [Bifidobacterium gallicum]KFI59174.1 acetyltransferase [Bifidobacterium gallicum DSM 20093 = LMG 11596]